MFELFFLIQNKQHDLQPINTNYKINTIIYKTIPFKHTYRTTQRFHWMVDELYKLLFYLDCITYALHHIKQMPYFHQDLMSATKISVNQLTISINNLLHQQITTVDHSISTFSLTNKKK
jgi:hypothetical protein